MTRGSLIEGKKHGANAAALLLELNQPEPAWKLLHSESDPRATTYLVARLADCRSSGPPAKPSSDGARSVGACLLLLTLGSYPVGFLGEQKEKIEQQVLHLCQDDPNCRPFGRRMGSPVMEDGRSMAALRTQGRNEGRRDGFGWITSRLRAIRRDSSGSVGCKAGLAGQRTWPRLGRNSHHLAHGSDFRTVDDRSDHSPIQTISTEFPALERAISTGDCPINAVSWFDGLLLPLAERAEQAHP